MRSLIWPAPRRVVEATPQQVIATGAAGYGSGGGTSDSEQGWQRAGSGHREVPWWTVERARTYSVAAYRSNPMARAIVDTYTAFAVGDSGVTYHATNAEVGQVVAEFWRDPRNKIAERNELMLRDHLLMGESAYEMLVGENSGVVRYSPIAPDRISDVTLHHGNPLWPNELIIGADEIRKKVVDIDDTTNLRDGEAMFWPSFKALLTDVRGTPFLMPVLDWLDNYDTVLSNLMDRTSLARYLVWDVTVKGDQKDVDAYVKQRGGRHIPPSGSVEVHNDAITWEAKTAKSEAAEDSTAARSVLTLVAAGSGLAKTWLAEPEDANRATSMTMAEPVRRRVRGVQQMWLGYQNDLVRFAVDRAVAAKRLQPTVAASDPKTGQAAQLPASWAVTVTGPEIAAADAEITAQVLLNLSTGLENLVEAQILTPEAASIAARKAWEQFVGLPYDASLDASGKRDDIATAVEDNENRVRRLRPRTSTK